MFNWKLNLDNIFGVLGFDATGNDGAVRAASAPSTGLPPAELKRLVISEANERAMSWDDCLDLPNVYEVRISPEDWKGYYGSRKSAVECRLEEAIEQFADEAGAVLDPPDVAVVVDGSLQKGEAKVDAYFADASSELVTPRLFAGAADADAHADREDAKPLGASRLGSGEVLVPVTVTPTGCSEHQEHSALLIAEDGTQVMVKDCETVGVVRDGERDIPDVELRYTNGMQFCSQVHAAFKHKGDQWLVENMGRNGLCINDNNWLVGEGAEGKIRDNDTIRFGERNGDVFVFRSEAKEGEEA